MNGVGVRNVTVGDIDVTYQVSGSGPPVVLLHGLAEDHASWQPVLNRLEGHSFHAIDLRGHGATTSGSGDGTPAQLAGDLAAFMEAVTGPAAVVGYSLGGSIALLAAAEHPAMVQQAVVIATSSVVGRAAVDFFAGRIAQIESGDTEGFAAGLHADTALQILGDADLDTYVAKRLRAVGDGSGYVNAARAMMAMADEPLTPRLADITCPVQVIAADGDSFCPPRAGRMIVDAVPGAGYHEIARSGHLLTLDQPDALAGLLDRLLREGRRGASGDRT